MTIYRNIINKQLYFIEIIIQPINNYDWHKLHKGTPYCVIDYFTLKESYYNNTNNFTPISTI